MPTLCVRYPRVRGPVSGLAVYEGFVGDFAACGWVVGWVVRYREGGTKGHVGWGRVRDQDGEFGICMGVCTGICMGSWTERVEKGVFGVWELGVGGMERVGVDITTSIQT